MKQQPTAITINAAETGRGSGCSTQSGARSDDDVAVRGHQIRRSKKTMTIFVDVGGDNDGRAEDFIRADVDLAMNSSTPPASHDSSRAAGDAKVLEEVIAPPLSIPGRSPALRGCMC